MDPSSFNLKRAVGCALLGACVFLLLIDSRANSENLPGLRVTHLRVEYLTNPLGMDVSQPRLSWELASGNDFLRDQRQTAYQIVASSDPDKLAASQGDVWDSGKISSGQTTEVSYAGKPLASKHFYYWKVRVWDDKDQASDWSESAYWSMGFLEKSQWASQWISDPTAVTTSEEEAKTVAGVNSGYRSAVASSPDTEKWVEVDLGEPKQVDAVRLYPAYPYDWQPGGPAYSYPVRFKIEISDRSDFSDASTVVDQTQQDVQPPRMDGSAPIYRFAPAQARYVRLVVTRLHEENELFSSFALAEMQVLANGQNLALGKTVSALDSAEGPGWSKAYLVDGITNTVRSRALIQPTAMFRKSFSLNGGIRRATVFATARGLYEMRINGNRVGDHVLAPEWTDYTKRIQYQTYDVTSLVQQGGNAIGVYLAAGWYAGHVGLMPARRIYGPTPEFLMHLYIEYSNGQTESVVTDAAWKRSPESPIVSSDVYDGETYDARKEQPGWDTPKFDDKDWLPVTATPDGTEALVSQRNEPIRVTGDIKPLSVSERTPDVYIFDTGQNHTGWTRLTVKGRAGTVITIRHGEALNPDGSLYIPNLRNAWQTDRYILRGSGEETFEPHFTMHGFRYVEVSGLPEPPGPETVIVRVAHSSSPEVGQFSSSSAYLNKLMSNILWTQRSNMMGIPTDCPQRDERLGWTGDEITFSQTAIFNMDMAGFFTKWMQDMRDDQSSDGRFPDVAPNPMNVASAIAPVFQQNLLDGSPAWADAGIIIPWRMYENYGDTQILNIQYESAKRWVDYVHQNNPDLLWKNKRGIDPGDWLNGDTLVEPGWPQQGATIPHDVFATAFFAQSTEILSKMAAATGRTEDARFYAELFTKIKAAFNQAYVSPDDRIEGDTQAGYALALDFGLLPDDLRPKAVDHMVEGLARYNGHVSTGFHATRSLMSQLTDGGHNDEAYRLLNLHSFPSWGYMLDMGATTVWERWDGYVADRGFENHTAMNSLDHVALGAVGEWIWRNVAGLAPDENNPGYKHFVVHPRPGGELTWAKGDYESVRGRIAIAWKVEERFFSLDLLVPPNTSATIYIPTADPSKLQESRREVREGVGVRFLRLENGYAVYEVGSGDFHFRSPM